MTLIFVIAYHNVSNRSRRFRIIFFSDYDGSLEGSCGSVQRFSIDVFFIPFRGLFTTFCFYSAEFSFIIRSMNRKDFVVSAIYFVPLRVVFVPGPVSMVVDGDMSIMGDPFKNRWNRIAFYTFSRNARRFSRKMVEVKHSCVVFFFIVVIGRYIFYVLNRYGSEFGLFYVSFSGRFFPSAIGFTLYLLGTNGQDVKFYVSTVIAAFHATFTIYAYDNCTRASCGG